MIEKATQHLALRPWPWLRCQKMRNEGDIKGFGDPFSVLFWIVWLMKSKVYYTKHHEKLSQKLVIFIMMENNVMLTS